MNCFLVQKGPVLSLIFSISRFATQCFFKVFGKCSHTLTLSIGFILTEPTLGQKGGAM